MRISSGCMFREEVLACPKQWRLSQDLDCLCFTSLLNFFSIKLLLSPQKHCVLIKSRVTLSFLPSTFSLSRLYQIILDPIIFEFGALMDLVLNPYSPIPVCSAFLSYRFWLRGKCWRRPGRLPNRSFSIISRKIHRCQKVETYILLAHHFINN